MSEFITETIAMNPKQQYQIVHGTPRHVYGARKRILRESHALVVQATEGQTAKGQPLSMWATDLRRERRNIYGSLLRFIDLLHRRGFPLETALLIPRWIEAYCRDVWGDRPSAAAVETERKAA